MIATLPAWAVEVKRFAKDEQPEQVSVLARTAREAQQFAVADVRWRNDLPPNTTLFVTKVRRAK